MTTMVALIPTMTSNTAPSGTASASEEIGDSAFKALDNNGGTGWYADGGGTLPSYNAYEFTSDQVGIAGYRITGGVDTTLPPKDFKLQGIDAADIAGDTNWIDLDTRTGITWAVSETKTFLLSAPTLTAYRKFRLRITLTGKADSYEIREWDLLQAFSDTLLDDVAVTDSVVDGFFYAETLLDDAAFSETLSEVVGTLYTDTLLDDLAAAEILSYAFIGNPLVTDDVALAEILSDLLVKQNLVSDDIFVWDTPKVGWSKLLQDDVAFAEILLGSVTVTAKDILTFGEILNISGNYSVLAEDTIVTLDAGLVAQIFLEVLGETLSLADILSDEHKKTELVAELLSLNTELLSNATVSHIISDNVFITEEVIRKFLAVILESLSLSDTLADTAVLVVKASDVVNFPDSASLLYKLIESIEDSADFQDSNSTQAQLYELLTESLIVEIEIEIGGETYICWVLSGSDRQGSVYTNFNFNSFSSLDGILYGAKSDGVYKMEGQNDDGNEILTGVVLDLDDLGVSQVKRIKSIYLGTESSPNALVQIESDRGNKFSNSITSKKFILSKSTIGQRWVVKLERLSDLESVEMFIYSLARKR